MKKKIFGFVLAICFILPCSVLLSACYDGMLDIAYVEFKVSGEQVVRYDSNYANAPQIYLYENQEELDKQFPSAILTITFKRGGLDTTVNNKPKAFCEIENDYYMVIWISPAYYDANKHIYLNGTKLNYVEKESSTTVNSIALYYENFGFVKGNTSDYVNIIEYKA